MIFRTLISVIILINSAATSFAEERKLTGAEITQLLPMIKTKGQSHSQTFSDKGLTTYIFDGRPSEGRWMVQDDQYCSSWPPNDVIECYDVLADTDQMTITWVGPKNSISKDTYKILEK